jgi:hypothetical protein
MTLALYNSAGQIAPASVVSFQTIAITAGGNTGSITAALAGGNLLVPWTGLRTAPGILTIPTAANSGNEMIVWDQANNAGAFPITVVPLTGAITGIAVISRNRGLLRLLDTQGGYGWLLVG